MFLNFFVGYVDNIHKLLFSLPLKDLSDMTTKYQEQVPPPMNHQFPERASKDDAIKNKESRKRTWTELFPPGELNIYHCPYSIGDALLLIPN